MNFSSTEAGLIDAISNLERIARILTIVSGLLFIATFMLYIFYLSRFPTDGNLEWSNSGGLVKVLLGTAILSGILSLGSFGIALLGWIKGAWSVLRRIHYMLIGIAYVLNIYLWTQLGFYDWILG